MIIINEHDMYIFFEIIKQLEPEAILDVGMFLKRIGGVSRSLKTCTLEESVELDGVDIYPETNFPVWKTMYNNIIDSETFFKQELKKQYDLMILLGAEEVLQKLDLDQLLSKVKSKVNYIFMDKLPDGLLQKKQSINNVKIIQFGEKKYYLWRAGE